MNPIGRQSIVRLAWLAGAALLCGLLVHEGLTATRASAESRCVQAIVRPAEVLDEPRLFISRPVTIDGEVARVFSSRAFALKGQLGRQGLLVVLDDPAPLAPGGAVAGQRVRVEGSVGLLMREDAQALEHSLGVKQDRRAPLHAYSDHPYVRAQRVMPQATR